MTYATYSVGTWPEVQQRLRQFTQNLGLTVGDYTDSNGNRWDWFTFPSGGPDIEFRNRDDFLYSEFEGLFARIKGDNPVKLGSSICSPVLGQWGNPVRPALSVLHCFGSNDPVAPYVAVVVEFASGFFRHLYMGRLFKRGTYTGGTVITSSNWNRGTYNTSGFWSFFGAAFRRPFSARVGDGYNDHGQEAGYIGGVHVEAPGSNGPGVRNFEWSGRYSSQWWSYYGRWATLGGIGDGIIDQYVSAGNAAPGASVPMFHINLYTVEDPTTEPHLIPIGHPPGVRYVNMKFLLPGQQIQVGTDNWRVFPVFKLNKTTWALQSPYGRYWDDETSYIVGLAYRE